ncbi:MAG: hypothetical protein NTW01_12350 [Gammaproteobacteria bacterium]|nr:hypothetical protein [Gammaproteobacteria bacterium]
MSVEPYRSPEYFGLESGGLMPIHCEVWEGFIFLNFQKVPEVTPAEFLGPFGTRYADIPNFNIDSSTGGFWPHEFWPVAYNRTRWILKIFIPKTMSVRHRL